MSTRPPAETLPRVELSVRRNSKHPWIYRKMCRPAEHAPGSLVEVYDREGRFAGRGIYNRKSQIAVRLLTEDPAQPLDRSFFERRVDEAIHFRHDTLRLLEVTDAYRLVNAEGDGLSGLVVDRLGPFLVAQLFSAGWYRQLKWLLPVLSRRFAGAPVLVKADKNVEALEGFRVRDFVAEELGERGLRTIIHENGLRYHVDLRQGHKTGFFCDQREHRLRVRELARGKRVLDGCCYTGGFALNAVRGGAASVVGIDLDEKAIAVAIENSRLNALAAEFQHADLYEALRVALKEGRKFDLVILDPPKLAAGRAEISGALRRYVDLNTLGLKVLERGGTLVTCSCSGAVSPKAFEEALAEAARRASAAIEITATGGAAADHVLRAEFPEGRYLKVLTAIRQR